MKTIEPCEPGSKEETKCFEEMELEGSIRYEVTTKTSEDSRSGTSSPIHIRFLGKKGRSDDKMLSEQGLKTGSLVTSNIFINDIGDIKGIEIKLAGPGKWKPLFITMNNKSQNKFKTFKFNELVLVNPGEDTYIIDTESTEDKKGSTNNNEGNQGRDKSLDINNPYGGLLDYIDTNLIIDLKCEQKLINPNPSSLIFGQDYPTKNVNYMNVLARCPSDCHKSSVTVYGLGIHPESSPICLSALVDKSISIYGGIISISIFPGLQKFNGPQKIMNMGNIKITSLNRASKKSYTVAKVDNIDLVEKDLRIIDNFGKLSHSGRLEIRKEGVWGTICAIGNDRKSASVICRELGYKNGQWRTPKEAKNSINYCKSYNSGDYCGAEFQPILYYKLSCSKNDNSINNCNKEFANDQECSHSHDAIIDCSNKSYDSEKTIPQGIVRLSNSNKYNGDTVIGRLEIFSKDAFKPVCMFKFSKYSAIIACKQMGFEDGLIANELESKKYQMEKSNETGFASSELQCKGTEDKIKDCKQKVTDIKCEHGNDVVIICKKGKGDPSGKNQYLGVIPSVAPSLGKLGMEKYSITCNETGNILKFRGDPGSVFLVTCPKKCNYAPGSIWGTGIYTSDSFVCKAAIHAGVIDSMVGGKFALIKTWGSAFYEESINNDVLSFSHKGSWPASFFLSKINSGWENMNKYFNGSLSAFIEVYNNINVLKDNLLPDYYSFIQTEEEDQYRKPLFEFIPTDIKFKFGSESNKLITEHEIKHLINFTFLAKFNMGTFKNEKSYIFSMGGCRGFNVFIDETGQLIFGDYCTESKKYKPNLTVPLKDDILIYLRFNKGYVHLRYQTSTDKKPIDKYKKIDLTFNFNFHQNIGIGRNSLSNKRFFYGRIFFIQIYDTEIKPELFDLIVQNLNDRDNASLKLSYTVDDRKCISICINDPIPGNKGSPNPPELSSNNLII